MAARINEKKRTVSIRKIEANRRNALKSTGPKTLKGKVDSARNAVKHGLFSRQVMDFVSHGEDPTEYEETLNGLRAKYQPLGTAEELEVERIGLCWWRFKRAWRGRRNNPGTEEGCRGNPRNSRVSQGLGRAKA